MKQLELLLVELVKQMPLHPVEKQVSLLVLEKWKRLREHLVFRHLPLLRLQCQSLVFHRVQVEWQLSSLSMWIRIPMSIRYSMPRTSWP